MNKKWIVGLTLAICAGASNAQALTTDDVRQIHAFQSQQTTQLQQLVLLTTTLVQQNDKIIKSLASPPSKRAGSGSVQEPDEFRFCYADGSVFSEGMVHSNKTCIRSSTMRVMEDGEERLPRLLWK